MSKRERLSTSISYVILLFKLQICKPPKHGHIYETKQEEKEVQNSTLSLMTTMLEA